MQRLLIFLSPLMIWGTVYAQPADPRAAQPKQAEETVDCMAIKDLSAAIKRNLAPTARCRLDLTV